MLDGFWQRRAIYDGLRDSVQARSCGTHREVGLCDDTELERRARSAGEVLREQLADVLPWIEQLAVEAGSRRTDKRRPGRPLSSQRDEFIVVNLVVKGPSSRVPVRWQFAGEDALERLRAESLREEVTAARLGERMTVPRRCRLLLDPWNSSQLIHECIGHTSEGDNFLQFARPAGLDLGHMWCRHPIQIYDDPTLPGRRGSYDFDDDGEPARCAQLVRDGRWRDLLLDARHASQLAMKAGHGRRVLGARASLPRMSNTYLAPGEQPLSALIAQIEDGILCCGTWGGGSMGMRFVIRPAYGRVIRRGRLTEQLLRGFDITGDKREVMAAIRVVSNELQWLSPIFGCDKNGQEDLPVSFGAPHVLIEQADLTPIGVY